MYPEFIAIYVGMGVLAILLIAAIVMLALVLKKLSGGSGVMNSRPQQTARPFGNAGSEIGVVFCRNCATQYDGATRVCPRCGTPR